MPELEYVNVDDLRIQQDGPTGHRTNETSNSLKETFSKRITSQREPPRSCDLIPLFLRGQGKSVVHAHNAETSDALKKLNSCP